MTKEIYIIFFPAGASGRFLVNILTILVKFNEDIPISLTDYNSAHNMNFFGGSYSLKNLPKITKLTHQNPYFFEYVEPTISQSFIINHQNPNFDLIFSRFPEAKVIIISVTENDFYEVNGNSLLKNGFELLDKKNNFTTHNKESMFIENFYKTNLKQDYKGQNLPIELKKKLFDEYNTITTRVLKRSFYVSPNIPNKYIKRTLVIPFYELMHNMDFTLQNVSNFINYKVTSNAILLYQKYLSGRKKLLSEHLPWIYNNQE